MSIETINKKISVIIVDFNSREHTINLINSLSYINIIIGEIIVVVNGNNLLIPRNLKQDNLKIIENKSNLGFAKAVNIGIKSSKFEYILLLNPDTKLIDSSIIKMLHYLINGDKIGAIGGRILDYNTDKNRLSANSKPNFLTALFEFTNLKKIFPNNHFSRKFWIENDYQSSNPIQVNSVCGAFLLFRKKLENLTLSFNEKYFLYLEDIDFGTKINNLGFKVLFFPEAAIKHIGGATSKSKYKTNLKAWYKSRKIYFKENCNFLFGDILFIIFSIEEVILHIYHSIKNEPIY